MRGLVDRHREKDHDPDEDGDEDERYNIAQESIVQRCSPCISAGIRVPLILAPRPYTLIARWRRYAISASGRR